MINKVKALVSPSNRSLIRELVSSDFKLRYQGSVLGYLWSLLRPLMLFGVLYVVFTKIIKVGGGVPYYPVYLLLGLVMWTFFVEATVSGMHSITGRGDLIRKVSIPKYVIVLSTTISAFINFTLNMVVVIIFMIANQVPFAPISLIWIPILIFELFVFASAMAFLLATLFVHFRGFSHIWDVVLQVLFYATPVIYPLTIAPVNVAKIISLNPLAQIVQDARGVLITSDTLTTKEVFNGQVGRLVPLGIVAVLAVVAYLYFKQKSKNFAEEL